MAHVYISCSPSDAASAQLIQTDLKSKGISCIISCIDAAAAVRSENVVPVELVQANFFVILVSKRSLASSDVKNELYWATKANRSIFPVRLDDTPLPDTFHFYLGTKQWITAKRRMSAASRELCDVIYRELHHIPLIPSKDTWDQEESINDKKNICIRAGLVILILVTFLVVNTVSFALLRKENLDLFWKIDNIMMLVVIVAIFLVMAPMFGGYKVFLRTVLEKLRDAFSGK